MIASSILLLLLTARLAESSCLYCVSPIITLHPRKFDASSDRTFESEIKCARNLTKIGSPAGCNGACLTMNVTREGETEPSGVLRDCLDSHKLVKRKLEEKRESDSFAGACYSQEVYIKGYTYTATYCACVGRYCNSEGTPLAGAKQDGAPMRAMGRRGSRNGAPAGVQPLSLAFVALLAARGL